MGRLLFAMLGITALAIGAFYIVHRVATPAHEKVEAGKKVLTEAYKPQLVACRELEDSDVPETLARAGVDEDVVYLEIVVLYPGVDRVPQPRDHRLIGVNGQDVALDPASVDYNEGDDGAYLTLIFKADNSFQYGRLVRGPDVLFERVELQ